MNARAPAIASTLAQAAHAGYLRAVAACQDRCFDLDPASDEVNLFARVAPLEVRQAAHLVDRLGVPPMALQGDGDGLGWPLLTARVEFVGGRAPRFAWRDDGVLALVTVLRGEDGSGADAVALGLRDGLAGTLDGAAMLGRQDLHDDPVTVHRDAAAWLRAGRRGVVLLERGRCLAPLRRCRAIVVADRPHGLILERALKPRLPSIGVAEAG